MHQPQTWTRRHWLSAHLLWALPLPSAAAAESAPAAEWAEVWDPTRSPAGFAVSEKLDGVRALWDGRRLRFRSGRVLAAPAWWLARLPVEALDGELWLGRGRFAELSGRVRRRDDPEAWRGVRYMVFDAPRLAGDFAQRLRRLQALNAADASVWRVLAQGRVGDAAALRERLHAVVEQGGEGLVLHRWDADWRPGRSGAVFKYKVHADAEAQVVAYRPGQDKYAGQVGALLVRDEQGRVFALGSGLSDAQRRAPPAVGAWVTYRHQGLTRHGLPRFAVFVRERPPE